MILKEKEIKMPNQYSRTELLIGEENIKKLQQSKVAIFGVGGVGSFVVEALARAGVGTLVIIDHDEVDITNINRQIIATHDSIGRPKVEVAKERILTINPNAEVIIYKELFSKETEGIIDNSLDYVVDCVDTVTAKLEIISRAKELNIPVISSMGTGNKLDPTKFEVEDIYKTSVCPLAKVMRNVCPLAKVMRKELRARNIDSLKVVYSKEEPIKNSEGRTPGSISFVPSSAGLIIAGVVIKDILKMN